MKIQIIALGMTDQSHRIFYNTQDMGLGRALAEMGHTVDLYSFRMRPWNSRTTSTCIICTAGHSDFIPCIRVILSRRMWMA